MINLLPLLQISDSNFPYKTSKKKVSQKFVFTLKNNIHEYLQDPLIVYKHAHLEQDTVVHMERGTTFLYKEIINQGWSDTGQPFLFQELRLKLKVYEENRRKAMVKQQSFRKEPI